MLTKAYSLHSQDRQGKGQPPTMENFQTLAAPLRPDSTEEAGSAPARSGKGQVGGTQPHTHRTGAARVTPDSQLLLPAHPVH